MTMYRIKTKVLPFNDDVPLPQKNKMEHNNNVYELIYTKNSFDGQVYLKIRDYTKNIDLYSFKAAEGGSHIIRDNNGNILYALYVKEVSSDNIDIRLLDEMFSIEEI